MNIYTKGKGAKALQLRKQEVATTGLAGGSNGGRRGCRGDCNTRIIVVSITCSWEEQGAKVKTYVKLSVFRTVL